MKNQYTINLLKGNHGIWLFVKKDDKHLFEQAGLKTPSEALQFALQIIEQEEKETK